MSSSDSYNTYTITISGLENNGNLVLSLPSQFGFTDTLALNIASALSALTTWPTGTTFSMQKDAVSETGYQVNFSATPLAFT